MFDFSPGDLLIHDWDNRERFLIYISESKEEIGKVICLFESKKRTFSKLYLRKHPECIKYENKINEEKSINNRRNE